MIGDREDRQLITFAPTPTPVPTVTVTQFVPVPTSLPTPIVSIPPDDVGWPVLMDGFFGAILGALIAIATLIAAVKLGVRTIMASWRANTTALQAAERARREQQRIELADRLLVDVDKAFEAVLHHDYQLLTRTLRRLIAWRQRLEGMYGHMPAHKPFTTWLWDEISRSNGQLIELGLAIEEQREAPREDRRRALDDLLVIERSIVHWIAHPDDWAPAQLEPDVDGTEQAVAAGDDEGPLGGGPCGS